MMQNLVDKKQTHRALEGIQLCKGHERISRENQKVCRFLGSVLTVSNSTFSANLERPHEVGSPFLGPSSQQMQKFSGKSSGHFTLCTRGLQPLGVIVLCYLCLFYKFLGKQALFARLTPVKGPQTIELLTTVLNILKYIL
uniref:Uncharacterized protein n=1 Tax=Rousettus aegyptiacus TaxID=9407 RepID=A0A7J8C2E0_ROUAE|nr:hypothetical protein HJG63_009341 [Rousettus aegyptiacus]